MIMIPLDRKVCSCTPVLIFLRLLPTGDTTKCRSRKYGKNWGFSPPERGRINRSRRNLAGKRIPWVCYSTPNLALIGKGCRNTAIHSLLHNTPDFVIH